MHLQAGSGKSRVLIDYVLNHPDMKRAHCLSASICAGGWPAQFEKHGGKPVVCVD